MELGSLDFAQGRKGKVGLFLGPALFAAALVMPLPGMAEAAATHNLPDYAPRVALGTMLWMVTWWVTECFPLGITGLLAPLVFAVTGVLAIRDALANFADPIIWIFIAGFILAAAFGRWGLDRRIAYSLAAFYRGSDPRIAVFFVACLPVFLLTMTGSITASTTIVFPFVMAFLATFKSSGNGGKQYAEASLLALGQAATAGAMLLLISTAPNLVAKATVEKFVPGGTVSFVDWFAVGTPHAVIGLLISWTVVFAILRPKVKMLPETRERFREGLAALGRVKAEEKLVVAILLAAMFLWIVPSVLRSAGDLSAYGALAGVAAALRNVSEAVPAVIIVIAMAVARTGRKSPPLLRWDEMVKAVDWNVVLLFGGGLALGLGMETSGLAGWMGSGIAGAIGSSASPWLIFAASAAMGFAVSYAASNTASAVITCPIAAALAIGAGINPIPPIVAAGLACSISSAIPSTTPPMAIIYSSKMIRISSMFRTGVVSDFARLAVLIAVGPALTGLVFP